MAKQRPARTGTIEHIWMVSREYEGLAGAGGVKDMVRQAAEAAARAGRRVSVSLPAYGFIDPAAAGFSPVELRFEVDMDYAGEPRRESVEVWHLRQNGVDLYLLDSPRFREKTGVYTYTAEDELRNPFNHRGDGHFDFFATNVLLQKATLALIIRLDEHPQTIHCHDGHAALLPPMLRELDGFRHYFGNTGCVVTIHNAGVGYHQEVGDLIFARAITGLPLPVIYGNLLNGDFDPLLAASGYALLNTVSENYARELQETTLDSLTGGLGRRLLDRGVRLAGITNGINPADFNPRMHKKLGLAAPFNPVAGDLDGKRHCRADLVGLLAENNRESGAILRAGRLQPAPELPLFTFIGRLTSQKGVDKLVDALETLLAHDRDFQVVILGNGEKGIENSLVELAEAPGNDGRIAILVGYSPGIANKVYAAGDFFLIPSQFEPCGLTDFIAQLFGNLPVVHHTGGLVKVEDGVTGFAYHDHSSAALMGAMQKALHVFRHQPETIRAMQRAAIERIGERYTWDAVIHRYFDLYAQAAKIRPAPPQPAPI